MGRTDNADARTATINMVERATSATITGDHSMYDQILRVKIGKYIVFFLFTMGPRNSKMQIFQTPATRWLIRPWCGI